MLNEAVEMECKRILKHKQMHRILKELRDEHKLFA